jgi:hypothetical protein
MTPRKMVPRGTALSLSLLSLFALGGRSVSAQTNTAMPPGQPMPEQGANPAPSTPVPGTSEALPPPAQEPAPVPMPPPPPVMAPPPAPPVAPPAPPAPPVAVKPTVNAKFSADLYGFVEFDSIFDTTQSLGENAGNAAIAKSGTFAGDHKRLTFTPRNSRLGVKLKGPDSEDIHTSAVLEMDFLGNQPATSEAATLQNGTFRVRHLAAKLETPYVNILAGQYWQLFGWQTYFQPNTVEIQGVPGEVYSRAPQFRLSHAFKTEDVTVEIAVAASRPPQRDGSNWIPDAQGGLRLLINNWKGWHTPGSVSTAYDAAGLGVSGVFRRFNVNDELGGMPLTTHAKNGGGVSVDALIPVIPGKADSRDFSLTFTGSYVRGTGIADLFSGLSGGIGFPPAPGTSTYTPNIDAGLVTYDTGGNLHTIDWQVFMGGLQFYLPDGFFLSGNYMHMNSANMSDLATNISTAMTKSAYKRSQWADGNLFWDVNKAFRLGTEVAWFKQAYVDNSTAHNWRVQGSVFYIF